MESPVKMYITGAYYAPRKVLMELMDALIATYPGTCVGWVIKQGLEGDATYLSARSVIALSIGDCGPFRREWFLQSCVNSWNEEYTMTWQEAYNRYCSYNDG
jgi:hypothetical protein